MACLYPVLWRFEIYLDYPDTHFAQRAKTSFNPSPIQDTGHSESVQAVTRFDDEVEKKIALDKGLSSGRPVISLFTPGHHSASFSAPRNT
jgi:hypothetical protein